jgi:hypothetical protein
LRKKASPVWEALPGKLVRFFDSSQWNLNKFLVIACSKVTLVVKI